MTRKTVLHIALALSFLLTSAGLALAARQQAPTDLDTRQLPWFINYVEGGLDTSAGAYPSIGIRYTGDTYIAYYDGTNADLRFAHYVGADGDGNCGDRNLWFCETVDSEGDVGRHSSLAFTASSVFLGGVRYGISYYDATNGALKYAYYNCTHVPPITCEWIIETIQDSTIIGASYGTYTVLKYQTDNTPIIAYRYSSNIIGGDALKYAYYVGGGTGDCGETNDWVCETIDASDGTGQYISMDLDANEAPHFTYYDSANNALRYAWYQGIFAEGCSTAGWECLTIDTQGGKYSSYNYLDGDPDEEEVAYYDPVSGMLKYAYVNPGDADNNCGDDGGTFTWRCEDMENIGVDLLNGDVFLTLDGDNYPLIAYLDGAEDLAPSSLRIARPNSAIGEFIGNCGPSGGLFDLWTCTTLDNGDAELDEAYYLSAATNPETGLVGIAYYENDEANMEGNLKIAWQWNVTYLPVVVR